MMRGIRSKNTSPEIKVRKFLHRLGFRFRLHRRELPGQPDIVLPRYRVCIFVHGCFWHRHPGCKYTSTPKTREDFWLSKFRQNVERDARNRNELLQNGWRIIEIWECGLRKPEPEMAWLQETIPDCNQRYVSWPAASAPQAIKTGIGSPKEQSQG